MHQELDNLVNILDSFLSESKSGISDLGQIQYCCPQCAEDDGVESDHKYNLEVNLLKNKYRCWKCEFTNGMSGKLSNLIKKYGGENNLSLFRDEVKNIKKSKEYELNFIEENLTFDEDDEFVVNLPEKTLEFLFDGNKSEEKALNYLLSRGITEDIIKKYNLKYTNNYCPNRNFRHRIIIPSYNKYGELNYYTGRDYTETNTRKYFNLEDSNRKELIFNERFVNWDGDITLVEGPVDHIVVPNSVPLLGKAINPDFYLFENIMKKSTQKIIVFLDDDAYMDAINICKKLSCYELCNRLQIIPTKKLLNILNETHQLNLKKLDPGKLFELYGYKGIAWAIQMAEDYECQ